MIDSSATCTAIFVATAGDAENFRDCMDHLQPQSAQRSIEVVDHVAQMSAAYPTDVYVQVDEDMILFPDFVSSFAPPR
jgi:hypothetical protein